jgi:hypothetical protein
VREELAHFAVELRGKCLVVRKNQRRPLHSIDHRCHRKGLPRARHAEQGLLREAAAEPVDEAGDRLRLVAGRRVVSDEL